MTIYSPTPPLDGRKVSDVIGALTRHIRTQELGPGDRLPSEADLARQLSVSRAVVREAFQSLAALRLILRGTFDRHPELQIVLGHWGEMLLFALDRIDGLSNVATHLQRRVAEYFQTNIHISTSGMLAPRLLRHALEYVSVERILLSGDYPFHQLDAVTITDFLQTLPDCEDQQKIAYVNAESLYGLSQLPPGADGQIAQVQEQS